jgi:hypothetical protein
MDFISPRHTHTPNSIGEMDFISPRHTHTHPKSIGEMDFIHHGTHTRPARGVVTNFRTQLATNLLSATCLTPSHCVKNQKFVASFHTWPRTFCKSA